MEGNDQQSWQGHRHRLLRNGAGSCARYVIGTVGGVKMYLDVATVTRLDSAVCLQ